MTNKIFQDVIYQMKDTMGRSIGVVDNNLNVIASSDVSKIGEKYDYLNIDPTEGSQVFIIDGYTYKTTISEDHRLLYTTFIEGTDDLAEKYASLFSIAINNVNKYYDEKYDRANFIKNVILENILPGDIYVKARELYFNSDVPRVVFLIRSENTNDSSAFDVVQSLFPNREHDFVFNINENDIVLVKEIKSKTLPADLEKLASSISDTVSSEFYTKVTVGIGTTVTHVRNLARSYKEAQAALEIGKVLDVEQLVTRYDNLGIARLIYQLPVNLCDMFMREVFRKGSLDILDHETLYTVQKFFENNLNISETARKLFIHRNTLVYRLDKIAKITGLDLRIFDQAITFKVAMMVKKYLSTNPVNI
ncbi:MAG: helix-turn-helix domain-containing protein [Oscillospiraceae bacterium]|nr:helix-turn-helix domain-containing protein [Oscillospiraceae bacterium]